MTLKRCAQLAGLVALAVYAVADIRFIRRLGL